MIVFVNESTQTAIECMTALEDVKWTNLARELTVPRARRKIHRDKEYIYFVEFTGIKNSNEGELFVLVRKTIAYPIVYSYSGMFYIDEYDNIQFEDDAINTAFHTLKLLQKNNINWVPIAKELTVARARRLIYQFTTDDISIFVEYLGKDEFGRDLYRFKRKIYSITTFTFNSDAFVFHE